ncbi:MAG: Diphthamide biosynthesis protein 2 [Vezdaea aestivalis]|nr:MAG: Diphthamide biosynthesis protein 2 [Vezdaea aestivalis]
MAANLDAPPVLSTPDHILDVAAGRNYAAGSPRLSDIQLRTVYEIDRTVRDINSSKWSRIALQFPDDMLKDAPRIFEQLEKGLAERPRTPEEDIQDPSARDLGKLEHLELGGKKGPRKLFILADTSYGACCVDEVAAEHVDADVVVHYGRTCLSPTSRIPVLHIFTQQVLDSNHVTNAFIEAYSDKTECVILMADVTYSSHVAPLSSMLKDLGYQNIYPTSIKHDPSSLLPNRNVPPAAEADPDALKSFHLFHISTPPESLLLALSSRVSSIRIFPTGTRADQPGRPTSIISSTTKSLQRRYALLTRLASASIFGILINTLSVKNYLHIVERVKRQIHQAGKKSYTFVVGKVNAAKVANFSEIEGWVVIGCWESSLIDSKNFWKPILTPFELSLALQCDDERVWTGEWSSDFQVILDRQPQNAHPPLPDSDKDERDFTNEVSDSEEESAPPEFDLRSGRYVSRPRQPRSGPTPNLQKASSASQVAKRRVGDLATIRGQVSPAAEFLKSHRTWTGLGSDIDIAYEEDGAQIEQGQSGIARGYTVNKSSSKQ